MDFDKGLVGGTTVLLVLGLLQEQDYYGYALIAEISRRSDTSFQFKEGTLYPVLHKLENDGFVTAYRSAGENGKERKYYHIAPRGEKRLAEEKEKFHRFTTSVGKVMGGVCFG